MARVRIDVYSHGIHCTQFDFTVGNALWKWCFSLSTFEQVRNPDRLSKRRWLRRLDKTYAGVLYNRKAFAFHRHQYDELIRILQANGIWSHQMEIITHPIWEFPQANFQALDTREPAPWQVNEIDYLMEDKHRTKLLTMQTGKGKTYCSLQAIARRNTPVFMLLTMETYIQKWIIDVKESLGVDARVIKGSDELIKLIRDAKKGPVEDFIICSTATYRRYIKAYEDGERIEETYGCHPYAFFKLLNRGLVLRDEVHEHFHANYLIDVYTHVPLTISLTATLEDDNPFIEERMNIMFPFYMRPPRSPYDRYAIAKAYFYSIKPNHMKSLRWIQHGKGFYNHGLYESCILKYPHLLESYCKIIYNIAQKDYFVRKREGQKLLIFCARVEMCSKVRDFFRRCQPTLTINKYTNEDSTEVLYNSDIVISTLLSAGTAVDIEDLINVILTPAIRSKRQNSQSLGRLRKPKRNTDIVPIFSYLVCRDIEEQINYHQSKVMLFKPKVMEHRFEHTGWEL